MKKSFSTVRNKLVSKYLVEEEKNSQKKSTDINILLNRVKLDQKRESRKKILFSAMASIGVLIFGVLVF